MNFKQMKGTPLLSLLILIEIFGVNHLNAQDFSNVDTSITPSVV